MMKKEITEGMKRGRFKKMNRMSKYFKENFTSLFHALSLLNIYIYITLTHLFKLGVGEWGACSANPGLIVFSAHKKRTFPPDVEDLALGACCEGERIFRKFVEDV